MQKNKYGPSSLSYILLTMGSILIAIFSIYRIRELVLPSILNDEFGYWANAAHIFGYDWSGVVSMSPYYSYGYSLFLFPFFLLKDPTLSYQCGLLLNVIFYIVSYLLSFKCCNMAFKKISKSITAILCLIPALYCNNLLQAHVTWTEGILYLFFWLLIFLLLNMVQKGNLYYFFFCSTAAMFLYVIHQRTLGVVLALAITLLIFFCLKKVSLKQLLSFFIPLLLCAGVALLIKADFKASVWSVVTTSAPGANEYSGQINKIIAILTDTETFLYAVKGFIGKFFYLLVSSCGLAGYGIIFCFRHTIKGFREKAPLSLPAFFLLLSLFFTLGINTVFTVGTLRIDAILYGRYAEFLIGPFLLLGIIFVFTHKSSWKWFLLISAVMFICALSIRSYLHQGSEYLAPMSVGTSLFFDTENQIFMVRYALLIPILLGAVLCLSSFFKKEFLKIIVFLPVLVFWILSAKNVVDNSLISFQRGCSELVNIANAIKDTDEGYPVYFIYNENYSSENWHAERIQFMLPDKSFEKITYDQLEDLSGDYYVVHLLADSIDTSKYTSIANGNGFQLFVPSDSELSQYTQTE